MMNSVEGSAQKRKRDTFDSQNAGAGVIKTRLRPVGKLNCEFIGQMSHGKVFESGDILLVGPGQCGTLFKDGIFRAGPVSSTFDIRSGGFQNLGSEVDSYEDSRKNRHYFACTKDANVIFAISGDDDRLSIFDHKIVLGDSEEKITAVCCAGKVFSSNFSTHTHTSAGPLGIVGSSSQELYVIGMSMSGRLGAAEESSDENDVGDPRRIFAYPLRRPRGLLQGLMQSSARLLGLAWPATVNDGVTPSPFGIVKLLHVPHHRVLGTETLCDGYLLAFSDRALCLWQLGLNSENSHLLERSGSSEGREKFLWEIDVRSLLERDMRAQVEAVVARRSSSMGDSKKQFRFLDALVLASTTVGSRDGKASVLLLSVSASSLPGMVELWVHGVDLDLRAKDCPELDEDSSLSEEAVCTIKLRRRVAICAFPQTELSNACKPRLVRRAATHGDAVIVLWGAMPSSGEQPTLHAVELVELKKFLGVVADSTRREDRLKGNRHGSQHPLSNVQMSSGADDSQAYPHYLLLHDAPSARSSTQGSSNTSSSMSEGVGADTGIHCDAVVGANSVRDSAGLDGTGNDISIVLKGTVLCLTVSEGLYLGNLCWWH